MPCWPLVLPEEAGLLLLDNLTSDQNRLKGSILQNSFSAEKFPDEFSSSNFGQISAKNNIYEFICLLWTIINIFKGILKTYDHN
jgi:hypothetical protein